MNLLYSSLFLCLDEGWTAFLRLCRFGLALASLEELEDPLESLSLPELSSSELAFDELEVDL